MRGAVWVCVLVALLVGTLGASRSHQPSLDEFEELLQADVPGDKAAVRGADQGFASVDERYILKQQAGQQQKLAIVPDGDNVPLWKEEGYEPYSDDLDADVTVNGMPDPIGSDNALTNRYENWKRNYKRVPNEKVEPWTYDGADSGPDMWGSLTKEFQLCDEDLTGPNSSPIDIPSLQAVPNKYGPSFPVKSAAVWEGAMDARLKENLDRSVTVEVMHCKQACKICEDHCTKGPTVAKTIEHPNLKLDRFLVHTPSEHKIDGEAFDVEMQFMQCDADVSYHEIPCIPKMAIAVLFKDGGANQKDPDFIVKLMKTMRTIGKTPMENIKGFTFGDVQKDLQPVLGDYYSYMGSQTYPPCYQGVEWFVATTVVPISSGAIKGLQRVQGENVRPTMPIGTRQVSHMTAEAPDHWTYAGPRGEDNWGHFGVLAYASCGATADCEQLANQAQRDICLKAQKAQSPIDIYTNECMPNVKSSKCAEQLGLRPVGMDMGGSGAAPVKVSVRDCTTSPCVNPFNGYAVTVTVPGAPAIKYGGSQYVVTELTFHTPAEHTLDGRRPDMEMQMVMAKKGGGKAPQLAIAVHFDQGPTSPQAVNLALVADDATGEPQPLDPSLMFTGIARNLVPFMGIHYTYQGSITHPPCTTGVTWLVLKHRLTVTSDDLKVFQDRHIGGNAREVQ
eukprot:CAMPEP_0169444384 /NCGR_PEP_ID=MMETSP1042-20121227/9869_1 /TAXON_ID=464988 /ORGANISM="Hemiselmis andersenii, Strain CCMP1180" /LENGTH=673 /DNA_ID=CAMNT_0009555693 /DNA_START=12 /DNA_END=2031 /DNA_ORIENTATION=-